MPLAAGTRLGPYEIVSPIGKGGMGRSTATTGSCSRRSGPTSRNTVSIGDPVQMNNIGQREFAKLIEASRVRRIKFHGLRHTSATLALKAGVPVKVVAQRLGHAKTDITNDIYAHALPSMQKDAAAKMSALLR